MFDKYEINARPQHVSVTTTVHEKRAPTDESVRLLKEMEEAARAKIIDTIRIDNTPIKCVVHAMYDPMNAQQKLAVHMVINGKKIEHITTLDPLKDRHDQALQLAEEVGTRIAIEALNDVFRQMFSKFPPF